MEIQGRIKTIFATEIVGQNGFQKRDLVITTDGQYPQDIAILVDLLCNCYRYLRATSATATGMLQYAVG